LPELVAQQATQAPPSAGIVLLVFAAALLLSLLVSCRGILTELRQQLSQTAAEPTMSAWAAALAATFGY
jgi:hypothetical protein